MKGISIGVCVAAMALAIGVAGCGSSNDTSSTTTAAAITKSDFLTQANAICADGNTTIDAAAKDQFSGKPTQADFLSFWSDTLIPSVTDQVAQIKALGIPAGDEVQVNAIIDSADAALADAQQQVDSGSVSNQDPFKETNQLANAYGMTECGG